jgi:Bacterial extracellular solute-binding protein
LASNALKEAYLELVPAFEKATEHKVATTWAGTNDILKRMAAGETYDLVIMAGPSLDKLIEQGKIVPGSRVDLAKSGVGVAVRAGAPKPDISSGDALKRALLAAKSIGYSSGPSGVYMESLFRRMGIADEIKPKLKQTQPGNPVGESDRARGSRDRLPAGQRAAPGRRHRLHRPAAAGRPAHHRVLGRHPYRRQGAGCGQGTGEVHHRAGRRRGDPEEGDGAVAIKGRNAQSASMAAAMASHSALCGPEAADLPASRYQ